MSGHADIIRRLSAPLAPLPTGARPQLSTQGGVRAVLFDIYGTLLVSASGGIGLVAPDAKSHALAEALAAVGMPLRGDAAGAVECFLGHIRSYHGEAREAGNEYPEVDVVEIWAMTLDSLRAQGAVSGQPSAPVLERLALEYECRANPVWPMPGARACLQALAGAGIRLGIVSNAQFYTPAVLDTLLGQRQADLGFSPELESYSYVHGQAKPGACLYRRAREALARAGIEPGSTLYVGNDMLNDIAPAHAAGFITGLFAGDRRSLRLREDEPRVAGLKPDLVFTQLAQIPGCIA